MQVIMFMKKVLYISNIEVPYRVRFLNELSHGCDLTVLYEREKSSNREDEWVKSTESMYRTKYLKGIKFGGENCLSFGIFKEIFAGYDRIIVGCYNSPVQMLAILALRITRTPYILNLDGEQFLDRYSLKGRVKRFFLKGADKYLVAGRRAAETMKQIAADREVIPYCFSSLSAQEVQEHGAAEERRISNTTLVVGQYYDYKGMDVALEAARMDPEHCYKFVGMGIRTKRFEKEFQIPDNVEIVSFLRKEELEEEYQTCSMLVLPSRRECWGLVVNEAASFGTPIVSTWGSGAAMEFLAEDYPNYLAKPEDSKDLLRCIELCRNSSEKDEYSRFLRNKSKEYHIEQNVQAHLEALR